MTSSPFPEAKETRRVAGLMSGTSLDGVDVCVADLSGSGTSIKANIVAIHEQAYPEEIRNRLHAASAPQSSSVHEIAQLNIALAQVYAVAIRNAAWAGGIETDTIDLIGCHGQTIWHWPQAEEIAGLDVRSTLQIGDGPTLATQMGIPVVSNFRTADMAVGGQGAPLVPYFDFAMLADPEETRLLINLGGIANFTVLRAGAGPEDVLAFDTGPANMVIDQLMHHLFELPYDADGEKARSGMTYAQILENWLADEYFHLPPPKSTGREYFGVDYVENLLGDLSSVSPEDTIAMATELTVRSVFESYERFVEPDGAVDTVYVSGGGAKNAFMMERLGDLFVGIPVRRLDELGIDSASKEALCFAILAHEYVNGVPTNVPSVTGADRLVRMGMLSMP